MAPKTRLTPQELVREAIVSGKVTNSQDGVAYIKRHFGEDMRTQTFGRLQSNVMEELDRQDQVRNMNALMGPHQAPTVPAQAVAGLVAQGRVAVPAQAVVALPEPTVEVYVTIGELVARHGADRIRDVLDLVEKIRSI